MREPFKVSEVLAGSWLVGRPASALGILLGFDTHVAKPDEHALVSDSRLGVRIFLPFAFHCFSHILGRRSQPVRFPAPRIDGIVYFRQKRREYDIRRLNDRVYAWDAL